jgi:Mg2+ and Co2+ transporter CorA
MMGSMTHVRGRVWRAGKPQDDFDFPAISDYLAEEDTLVRCDIYDPNHEILADLAQELGLNTWAVEDAVAHLERTKANVYNSHTFFTVYSVTTSEPTDESTSVLDIHRISAFVLPRGLITVRLVLPMREVVNTIQHRRLDAKNAPELDPLFADLYEDVLRVSEWTESLRDMVTTVFETNLSLQDARLNVVMKKLTGWAAIIAVPTAITGFYGQSVDYPGINTVGGFMVSTSIIVLLVITLYWMFRRRDWL